jgi:hypothetical protein
LDIKKWWKRFTNGNADLEKSTAKVVIIFESAKLFRIFFVPLHRKIRKYKFRMLRRYRKIKEDMPLFSGEDRGQYSVCKLSAAKPLSYISFYLHLSPSIYKASGACES